MPYMSKASMEALLKYVSSKGIPEAKGAKDMRAANRHLIRTSTAYGPLVYEKKLVCTDGSKIALKFVNYLTFLCHAYQGGGGFHRCLNTLLAKHGSLSLILYSDEISPGNPLASKVGRKCWVVYCAIKEMKALLSDTDAWVCLFVCRSSLVSTLAASMSQVMREILENTFRNPLCDVENLGILLKQPEGERAPAVLVKLSFAFFLQDGGAMKYCYSVKGDSGSRFCLQCKNIFEIKAKKAGSDSEEELPEVCKYVKVSQLELASDEEVLASWARMQTRAERHRAGFLSASDLKQWEQACGISWDEKTLLASPSLQGLLKPCTQWVHDWLHCLLSNGIFAIATFLWLNSLDMWETLQGYVGLWQLPKHQQGINISAMLDPARVKKHKKSGKMNCTASELLSLEPILTHFAQTVVKPSGKHLEECNAYLSLAMVVQMFQHTHHGILTPDDIEAQVEKSLSLWLAAGWQDHMIKKHHWLLHFSTHLRLHGMTASCFSQERKHKDISRHAACIFNTQYFEQGVIEEVVNQEMHQLSSSSSLSTEPSFLKQSLLPKKLLHIGKEIWPFAENVWTGHTLKLFPNGQVSKGDIVLLHGGKAGRIQVHLTDGKAYCSLISLFVLVEEHKEYSVWQEPVAADGAAHVISHTAVKTAVVWAQTKAGIVTLTPLPWR